MTSPVTNPAVRVLDLHVQEGDVLLVDKPRGWTSFDVAKKIRHIFRVRKVGHAGTLDPSATGLLILCTASRTKDISTFMGLDKEYEAEIVLGAKTSSFDAETPFIETRGTDGITPDVIREVIKCFVGPQSQVPPMWSAVKVQGRRLYTYARRGIEIERKPREVMISSIEVTGIEIPIVRCKIVCSKGTYIRALADDIGTRLGCGAYLENLRRTRIGPYHVSNAWTIEELTKHGGLSGVGQA